MCEENCAICSKLPDGAHNLEVGNQDNQRDCWEL